MPLIKFSVLIHNDKAVGEVTTGYSHYATSLTTAVDVVDSTPPSTHLRSAPTSQAQTRLASRTAVHMGRSARCQYIPPVEGADGKKSKP